MTKKDYQAIAGALYRVKPAGKDADGLHSYNREYARQDVWFPIVEVLADVLAADNPRFDRECFVAACEDGNVGRRPKRKRPDSGCECGTADASAPGHAGGGAE